MSQSMSSQSADDALEFDIYAGLPESPLDLGIGVLDAQDIYYPRAGPSSTTLPGHIVYSDIPRAIPPHYGYLHQTPQPEGGYVPYNSEVLSPEWYQSAALLGTLAPILPPLYQNTPQSSGSPHPASLPASLPAPPQRLRIPQTIHPAHATRSQVTFNLRDGAARGVRVCDVLPEDGAAVLDGHDERVLGATGVRQIRLVIAWPGYAALGTYIAVQDRGGPVTRAALARRVGLHVAKFVHHAAKRRAAPPHAQWAVGRRAIRLEQLWLCSVAHAKKNIWLAELEVAL